MICSRVGIDIKKHIISLKKEVFRKSIHVCTAFVPVLLHFYRIPTIILLSALLLFYIVSEFLRLKGKSIPLVSTITEAAARKRDENHFVYGPVTLVVGIIFSAVFFQEKFATVGILSLAFGDGLASLAGKTFGKIEVPLTGGKTAAGSLTCFNAIFFTSFFILNDTLFSLLLAFVGTVIEGLPLKDFDNIFIPISISFLAQILSPHI
ncbi:diacylglycerol/polyprenol kinase family protein [Treponema pectinovorum]|uniref:diacylglycerol/polyprenol kinase family protein n=1 Tax=Treponema pectinovorum TaxID=164 RepID=UPI0011F3C312|nr:phosphatidate cytidylyltransferase [Treponema pectinovorum]